LDGHLVVVAAKRTVIAGQEDLCRAMRWTLAVIDIQETAQRNLQSALAVSADRSLGNKANAALVLLDSLHAVLTICADGELFYARRFDLLADFLAGTWEVGEDDGAGRFLLEVQRSLDLWDRMWPSLPLDRIWRYAGDRGDELARWLTGQLGQPVQPMAVAARFPGFKGRPVADEVLCMPLLCMPLLGMLLRTEERLRG
jgi:MSHA biogenesis protein MshI